MVTRLNRYGLSVFIAGCFFAAVAPVGALAQTTHTPADWDTFQALKIYPGDTVQFGAATYKVDGQVELVSEVTYQGDPGGGTVIDGGGAFRAFTAWGDRSASDGPGASSINKTGPSGWALKGLTIQDCVADKSSREFAAGPPPVVNNPDCDDDGGAFNIDNGARGLIQNCTFKGNKTLLGQGGAIAVDGAATVVELADCTFESNAGDTAADGGGALVVEGSNAAEKIGAQVTITGCTFKNNSCTGSGGVLRQNGSYCVVTFAGCVIDGNLTQSGSGGVCQAGNSATTNFVNCVIVNNKAGDNRILSLSRGRVVNCTIAGNDPSDHKIVDFRQKYDGEIGLSEYKGEVINCLFINNTADGAIVDARDPAAFSAVAMNNIFFGNVDSDGDRVANVSENVKETGTVRIDSGKATSIVADPAAGNYQLVAGSPAIDAGIMEGAPDKDLAGTPRPKGTGCDIGAYEFAQP